MTRGLAYCIIFADGKHSSLYEVFENNLKVSAVAACRYDRRSADRGLYSRAFYRCFI